MTSLRIWMRVLNYALLGAVSYSAAAVTMQAAEAYLRARTPPPPASRPAAEREGPRERRPLAAFQVVLDTNMFNAKRSEVRSARQAGPVPASGPGQSAAARPPRRCG